MKYRSRTFYTDCQKALMWERWRQGESLHEIARLLGRIARKEVEQRLVVDLPIRPLVLHGLEDGAVVRLLAVVVEEGVAQVLDHVPVILGRCEALMVFPPESRAKSGLSWEFS